jgi:hypothetical protein
MSLSKDRLPSADDLLSRPVSCQSQADDLHLELIFGETFADVRFWVSRCGREDGEPFDRTVTVEVRHYLSDDYVGYWVELARYDGDAPPAALYPLPSVLRGSAARPFGDPVTAAELLSGRESETGV